MKRLKFKASYIPLILSGAKTATWRMKDDKHLTVGDEVMFVDASSGADFAKAHLADVKLTTIQAMTDEDMQGNVEVASKDVLLKEFQQIYGRDVTMDTTLKIVRFKIKEALDGKVN